MDPSSWHWTKAEGKERFIPLKILTDKAEYLTYAMILQIKDGHWKEIVKNAQKVVEIGKQIQAINA